jgi:uncharacterized protein YdiU (UPF0061 family)
MLREILQRTAGLIARWQDVGFSHGVMNSDNMSMLGLTIDYGPFGFLEDTDLNYVCNHSDHQGRYAFGQQPSIGLWNLERLFVSFLNHVKREDLEQILNEYPRAFEKEYLRLARLKMGLLQESPEDFSLFVEILQTLSNLSIDYTFFWRKLSDFSDADSLKEIWEYYGNREEIRSWLFKYEARLARENLPASQRQMNMKAHNPKYVLKNYIAQEIIEDVENGNSRKLNQWLNVLYSPFDEHADFEVYSRPTPPQYKHYIVSCSS